MNDKELMELLMEMLDEILPESMNEHFASKKPEIIYENIEDYTSKTGKRFRLTKDQKERGLTREEAFSELFPSKEK